jgi:hypothetical protein
MGKARKAHITEDIAMTFEGLALQKTCGRI